MTLRFTDKALEDLDRLHAFVAEKDPVAADRIRQRLLGSLRTLASQPLAGAPIDELPVRQWVAGDYIARYLVQDGRDVIIVRIWHAREDR